MKAEKFIKLIARDAGITEQQAEKSLTSFCNFFNDFEDKDEDGVDITKVFPKQFRDTL